MYSPFFSQWWQLTPIIPHRHHMIDKMHLSFPTLLHPSSASSSSSRSPLREMAVSSLLMIFSSTLLLTLLTLGWRILNWVWLRPKHLERQLREQGFSGNSYRLFFGDLKDNYMMSKRASSKPINFSDDITPRAIASVHHIVENYGTWSSVYKESSYYSIHFYF